MTTPTPRESIFLLAPLPPDAATEVGAALRMVAARVAFGARARGAPPRRLGLCAVAAGGDRLRVRMQVVDGCWGGVRG